MDDFSLTQLIVEQYVNSLPLLGSNWETNWDRTTITERGVRKLGIWETLE